MVGILVFFTLSSIRAYHLDGCNILCLLTWQAIFFHSQCDLLYHPELFAVMYQMEEKGTLCTENVALNLYIQLQNH